MFFFVSGAGKKTQIFDFISLISQLINVSQFTFFFVLSFNDDRNPVFHLAFIDFPYFPIIFILFSTLGYTEEPQNTFISSYLRQKKDVSSSKRKQKCSFKLKHNVKFNKFTKSCLTKDFSNLFSGVWQWLETILLCIFNSLSYLRKSHLATMYVASLLCADLSLIYS